MTRYRHRLTRCAIDHYRVNGEWAEVWYITGRHATIPVGMLEPYTV